MSPYVPGEMLCRDAAERGTPAPAFRVFSVAVLLSKTVAGARRRSEVHNCVVCGFGRLGGESFGERLFVLSAYAALFLAMQVQEIAEIFRESVDGVYGELDPEVRGVGICDRDLQHNFSAAVQLAQEGFAVEQPWIRQLVGGWWHGWHCRGSVKEVKGFREVINDIGKRCLPISYDIYCLMLLKTVVGISRPGLALPPPFRSPVLLTLS